MDFLNQSLSYFAALAVGCIATLMFALNEFERSTPDLPSEFQPFEMTTRQQYLTSFVLYVFGLEAFYVLLCWLGPESLAVISNGLVPPQAVAPSVTPDAVAGAGVVAATAGASDMNAAFPLWVAVVMIGIAPRFPFLHYVESSWRRLMHKRAAIPSEAFHIKRVLRRAPLRPDLDSGAFARFRGFDEGSLHRRDLRSQPESGTHYWVRLSLLVFRLDNLDTDIDAEQHFDIEFVNRHRGERATILTDYDKIAKALTPRTPSGAGVSAAGDAVPDSHLRAIGELLERTYMYLACALIVKRTGQGALDEALDYLGLQPNARYPWTRDKDNTIKAFGLSIAVLFGLVFVAPAVLERLPESLQEGWPSDPRDARPYALSAFLSYGVAIVLALKLRRRRIGDRAWFPTDGELPRAMSYLAATALALGGAAIARVAFHVFNFGLADLGFHFIVLLPFAAMPAVTGFFVCLLLDRAYLGRSHRWDAACVCAQVLLAASTAAVAARLQDLEWLERIGEGYVSTHGNTLFAALAAGGFAASIGTSTAWFSRIAGRNTAIELDEASGGNVTSLAAREIATG